MDEITFSSDRITELLIDTDGKGRILNVIESESNTFEEDDNTTPVEVGGAPKSLRGYVPWGTDNQRPLKMIKLIRSEGVMSSNKLFDQLVGYSGGIRMTDKEGNLLPDESEENTFLMDNNIQRFWAEQQADMKHFFFAISIIILSKDGKKIVELHHKEATYCRFETCNPKTGQIEHVFFGNWADNPSYKEIEVIPLLDVNRPYADLMVRMGRRPDPKTGLTNPTDKTRKFAIATVFPTVGSKYYPFPPYCSIFLSGWYKIQRLVPAAKIMKFETRLSVRWVAAIHPEYWKNIFTLEKITDPKKQADRVKLEKDNFMKFLTGIEKGDKTFVTSLYVNPRGETTELVRFRSKKLKTFPSKHLTIK